MIPATQIPTDQLAIPTSQAGAPPSQTIRKKSNLDLHARWIDAEDLEACRLSWDFLARQALECNPAMEANYLLPALKYLASDSVRVIAVEDKNAPAGQNLVAVVPVETKQMYRLPFKAAEVWRHDQCFNSTPLLSKDCAQPAWSQIHELLVADGYALLSLDTVSAAVEMDQVFQSLESQPGVTRFQRNLFLRAGFNPDVTADDYVSQHVSKSLRKKLRRYMGKLDRVGEVTWERSTADSDYEKLTEDFLRIEASGWKGSKGTALDCSESTRSFYRDLIRQSAAQGKARFLSLQLDGQLVAMISDIQSGSNVYCYKTAYDDTFASFSPGLQVEFKNIEYLHQEGIQHGDSCTAPGSKSTARVWGQRLPYQGVVFSLKPGLAQMAVRVLPKIQSTLKGLRNMKSSKSTGAQA